MRIFLYSIARTHARHAARPLRVTLARPERARLPPASDTNCEAVPALREDVSAGACRLDCAHFVVGARGWASHPPGACRLARARRTATRPRRSSVATRATVHSSASARSPYTPNFPAPFVEGSLTPAEAQAPIVAATNAIHACTAREVVHDRYGERFDVRISVGADGAVTGSAAGEVPAPTNAVVRCVLALARGWRFPATRDHRPSVVTARFYVDTE